MSATIHILFENPAWNPPLVEALQDAGFAVELHYLDDGLIDPSVPPAKGVWINRLSPSSHTRGHAGSVPLGREVLAWLEHHGRRVINGSAAFEIEMSKLRQDLVLRRHGIRTPRTALAVGRDRLLELSHTFDGPFITKHNRGGKGLGIRLFNSTAHLELALDDPEFDPGPGAMVILQQYIEAAEPFITRVEIVGGRFLFAMRSSTVDGFELCPSDACQLDTNTGPDVCPADGAPAEDGGKFSPSPLTADDPLVAQLAAMTVAEGIEVAGIEFIEDADGVRYTYDINGTTNYSGVLADQTGVHGMVELTKYLRRSVVPALPLDLAASK